MMSRNSNIKNKHKITHDFILDLYKETKKMNPAEKLQTVEKVDKIYRRRDHSRSFRH